MAMGYESMDWGVQESRPTPLSIFWRGVGCRAPRVIEAEPWGRNDGEESGLGRHI